MFSTTIEQPSAASDAEVGRASEARLELADKFREDSFYKFVFTGKFRDRDATLIVMPRDGESSIFGTAVKRLTISQPDSPFCPARRRHKQLYPSAQLPEVDCDLPAPWMISATIPLEYCRILYQVPESTPVRIRWVPRTSGVHITLEGAFDEQFEGVDVTFSATIRKKERHTQ